MDARAIDHATLHVPADGLADARSFYGDALGFELEGVERYRSGETPFFDVRLTPDHLLHLWPTEEFTEPDGTGYDHLALIVEQGIDEIEAALADAGIDVERRLENPLGATGRAPAVYVRDPFGYRVELKQPVEE
ncbi:VOC family protein [Halorarum halophilum]|uniref:VOC family protein n=1 Tax=Halorarum halophilum TaxID=2743090 RepID=A0A7D5GNT6_9EURY|nr:VOC family protein [Halobaculum halophilum]QLG29504.1 VOC family protein [Halobaculum halophilum]